MTYYKLDGTPLTIRERAELGVEHGVLTADKVEAMFKEKMGQQHIIDATKLLVHKLWGQRKLNIDTSVPYVPPVKKKEDNTEMLEWFKSRLKKADDNNP